jgi:hypothetical protein
MDNLLLELRDGKPLGTYPQQTRILSVFAPCRLAGCGNQLGADCQRPRRPPEDPQANP